jgi:hypothetical protein
MAIHPGTVENSFGGHYILWAIFLPMLTLIFAPLIWQDQRIAEPEIAMVRALNIDTDALTSSANRTFGRLFIATGAMPASESYFNSAGQATKGVKLGADWMHGVWLMVYKAVWRIHALVKVFFIPLIALLIPAAMDGLIVRARKKYRFETSNPIFFYSSMHIVVLMIGLFTFLPIAPITLSAGVLFVLLAGLSVGVWTATSNFQTGN